MRLDVIELEAAKNALVAAGDFVSAVARFAADDLVIQVGSDSPIVGRDACIAHQRTLLAGLEAIHVAQLEEGAVAGDVAFSLWRFEWTRAGSVREAFAQLAVRRWREGALWRERIVTMPAGVEMDLPRDAR